MFLAVAALLLQPFAVPQNLISPVATVASNAAAGAASAPAAPEPAEADPNAASTSASPSAPATLLALPEFDLSEMTFEPGRKTPELVSPDAMVTVIVVPVPADPANASVPASAVEPAALRSRPTQESLARERRVWLALSMAQHGAAAFDAWSTRRAISSGAGRELNPMLRPFAGNASLYAAIQVGPLALDYVGRRMMTSRHAWMRHTWWLPQTLGTAMSIASGANNLSLPRPE